MAFGVLPGLILASCLVLAACGHGSARVASAASEAAAPAPITEADLRWLGRVTFGVDTATVARYRELGRARFLDEQLSPPVADPPALAAVVGAIPITQATAEQLVRRARAEQQRIAALPTDDEKQQARTARNRVASQAGYETAKRHLVRALHSPAQLREQMTWLWMNHFSVFVAVAWTLAWPAVTGAIVGARRPSQVDGWLPAASLELTEHDLDEIAAAISRTGAGSGPRRPGTIVPENA